MSDNENNPLISFILPNYNNEYVIDLFFNKFLQNNTYDNYEFIVCDDGSLDNSTIKLEKWLNSGKIKNMTLIKEPHKGIINALNKCLLCAKGEFIIRCDGDATVETKSFVEKFLDFYYISPDKIGVITSKVMTDFGTIHALGRNVFCKEGLHDRGKTLIKKSKRNYQENVYIQADNIDDIINKVAEVDSALGVFTFSDRKTALEIGGFDYNYPLWIEDDDFYLSYRLHNKKVFYLPTVEVLHRFSLRGERDAKLMGKNEKFGVFKIKNEGNIQTYMLQNKFPVFRTKKDKHKFKYYIFVGFWLKIFSKNNKFITNILKKDFNHWKKKWKFDPEAPDIEKIKKIYSSSSFFRGGGGIIVAF